MNSNRNDRHKLISQFDHQTLFKNETKFIPTIVFYSEKYSLENINYLNDFYEKRIIYLIKSLNDIEINQNGEFLKSYYEYNQTKDESIKLTLENPLKISYFCNMNQVPEHEYEIIKNFKCFKTGSNIHNMIIKNKLIQKLIINT